MSTVFLTWTGPAISQIDFRGYALGETIDEFRTRPTPSGYKGAETRVICTDTDRSQSWLIPSPDIEKAGVVSCGFVEQIGSSTVRAGMPLTPLDHSASIQFQFHSGRLYRIDTVMDATVSEAIDEALTAKHGAPTTAKTEQFQTRSGAVFPQLVKSWRSGDQSVTLSTPDLTTERMSVIYLDEKAAAEVESLARKARNPASIM